MAKFIIAELAPALSGDARTAAMDGLAEALGQGADATVPRNYFIGLYAVPEKLTLFDSGTLQLF